MDNKFIEQAISSLNEKGVNLPCPRCNTNSFSVIGQSEFSVLKPAPKRGLLSYNESIVSSLPVVVVVCNNCGFVTHHALSSLGMSFQNNGLDLSDYR